MKIMTNHTKDSYMKIKVAIFGVICLFVILFCGTGVLAGEEYSPLILVRAETKAMRQEQEVPELTAAVEYDGNENIILNPQNGYTVKDLLEDLRSGSGYTLECKTDGVTEGKVPIQIQVSEELSRSLLNEWLGKVRIRFEDASLTVRNKNGEWDGKRFRKVDDTYGANEFVEYQEQVYYLDADGNRVTGWQVINEITYYFDKDGIRQSGWLEQKGNTYFLEADGRMRTGWLILEADTYYFDQEGKMLTGKQEIGTLSCKFAKDGKLTSSESHLDPTKPMIALTFDDGPGARTQELLAVLKKYDAHATFFMLGQNVDKYPDAVKQMAADGHELGNHSYSHAKLTKLDAAGIKAEIQQTNDKIKNQTGSEPDGLRPPYGSKNDLLKEQAAMPLIMWSVDTEDWKVRDVQTNIDYVVNTVEDGDIVLFHDIHDATIDSAIAFIPELIQRGYQLVTVKELAEARGVHMENGEAYYSFPQQ